MKHWFKKSAWLLAGSLIYTPAAIASDFSASFKGTDIQEFINRYRDYETKIDSIIKIQSFIRRFLVNRRGNRLLCNNEEDFYTYELLSDIDPIYFYTYKDTKDIFWGFDIRSFHKLIELNYPNPYTTEEIPQYIIDDVKKKIAKNAESVLNSDTEDYFSSSAGEEEIHTNIIYYRINKVFW